MKISKLSTWHRSASGLVMLALATCCAISSAHAATVATAPPRNAVFTPVMPNVVADGQAVFLGALDSSEELELAIQLPVRNQAGLDNFLQRLNDPTSPSYHQYLSVAQFTALFGPTQADYDAVNEWAKTQGLSVTETTPNRHILTVTGSVASVNTALNVVMGSYRRPGDDRVFYAPDREPSVTSPVALLAIDGLENANLPQRRLKKGTRAQIARAMHGVQGSGPGGVYLPSDMRAAYYGSGALDGAGQIIGVFSFDGFLVNDVPLFYTAAGITNPNVPVTTVQAGTYKGGCDSGGLSCDDGEQVLDIVNAIGMAPGASQVIFYEGSSGSTILNQMATDNLAKVLSCSWGSSGLGTSTASIFQEFQAQGQTFLNATGDDGAYDSVSWAPPSLNPYTLQVGATSLITTAPGGPYASETAWPDSGGGFYSSASYAIPAWQPPSVMTAAGGSATLRNDPDVAAEGDFDNPTVSNGTFVSGFGGTSFAAPRWAGFIALANEQALANGQPPLGFTNPAIYTIAGNASSYSADFHDVVGGSNPASDNPALSYTAGAGYDLVTGWGSPNGQALIDAMVAAPSSPGFVLSAYPTNPATQKNSSVTTTITVSNVAGFSDPVSLAVTSTLPTGVTAAFSPFSGNTSTLTLTTGSTAVVSATPTPVTITGTSGTQTRTATVNMIVGAAPAATITPTSLTFNNVLPLVPQDSVSLTLTNGTTSAPLSYSVTSAIDATCTGAAVPWLNAVISTTVLAAGKKGAIDIQAAPGNAGLAPGTYTADVCVNTNDSAHPFFAIPVTMTVIQGPALETLFQSGFESGDSGGQHVTTFTINKAAANNSNGSSLDLATGSYHTYSSSLLDNFNLYAGDDSNLTVYWYDNILAEQNPPSPFAAMVGGVVDSGGNYAVLQSGAIVGPDATFASGNNGGPTSTGVIEMPNFLVGVDGYIGIAFVNSQTHALNYGYIHVTTTAGTGFPAKVLDYGFDASGAQITVP